MKDIVFEKQSIFIRDKTADQGKRAKKRKRKRKRNEIVIEIVIEAEDR